MRPSLMARFSARRDEAGFTLIELLTSTALLAILGSVLVLAFSSSVRAQKAGQDEADGLGDVRTVIEQLGRDIRSARGVVCDGGTLDPTDPTCKAHLQLWIDYNSNYRIDSATETVVWQLVSAADGKHFEVVRTVNGDRRVVARSLIVKVAFNYDQQPTNANTSPTHQVTTFMTYDTLIGLGTLPRNVTFTERLRNVV
jgi:prepilin-type N-terminal cleavage/methylation domain-containing protein